MYHLFRSLCFGSMAVLKTHVNCWEAATRAMEPAIMQPAVCALFGRLS